MLGGLLKLATVSKIVSFSLKRQAREIAVTVALVLAGTFAALTAFAIAMRAFYLWLELSLGTFPALGIVGLITALLAVILFMLAFMRGRRRARVAPVAPVAAIRAAAPTVAATRQAAVDATDHAIRNASRQQVVGALVIAVIAGWILGKRL